MDERTGQIVSELLKERERLGDNIAALERKVKQKISWEVYFAKQPWLVMGIAVALGFLLSRLVLTKRA